MCVCVSELHASLELVFLFKVCVHQARRVRSFLVCAFSVVVRRPPVVHSSCLSQREDPYRHVAPVGLRSAGRGAAPSSVAKRPAPSAAGRPAGAGAPRKREAGRKAEESVSSEASRPGQRGAFVGAEAHRPECRTSRI